MSNKSKPLKKHKWESVKDNTSKVKSFFIPGRYVHKDTRKNISCQIRGCEKDATWITDYRGKQLVLCFGHGEDA